ncbi:hypothetical protein UFOVP209_31 [uncultured Caudovirales phage]|uniref:Minor tail protein n=1 Tax=uncultured Caudovirales phage TaxID=2100421 RepID=A0A6J7WRF9_9CAUD|nr:hypothetical protein UFOVP209_31 [uncultured Caudovirales phage]
MATYRCIALDLCTGARIAELPLAGLSYSAKLNAVGEASAQLRLPVDNPTIAAVYNDAVDESRRQLVIERDGIIVWCGIIWLSPYDDTDQTRTIKASEDWSYFRRRVINTTKTFTSTDQIAIARDLINTAQAVSGGNINITVGTETCGVTRDRVFNKFELKPVGEAVEQLAAIENGFDFAIDANWDPTTGALVKTFRPSYPRRGRNYSNTGHVFQLGRNMTSFSWPSDGTRTANRVWLTGNGEGDAMLITSATDTYQVQTLASGGPGYPLLETVVSNKDVAIQATLDAQARTRLQSVSTPVVLPEISVRANLDPVFGSYITGDACRILIPAGNPRFPNGLDTYRRIIGWNVSVGDDGLETVKLTLWEEPGA